MLNSLPLGLAILILSLLTGCSSAPPRSQLPADDPLAPRAEILAAQGDYAAAAQLYLNAAETASERDKGALRLQAAEYYADGLMWEPLATVLGELKTTPFEQAGIDRFQLLEARLALGRDQPEVALTHFARVNDPEALPGGSTEYYRLRARAYEQTGNHLEAARQLIWLDTTVEGPEARLANQQAIWEQLNQLSDTSLEQLRTAPPPDILSGWMELLVLSRNSGRDREAWSQQVDDWRLRYPGHPAGEALLPAMLAQPSPADMVDRLALLLPLSGKAAEPAAAVRDGVLSAYYSADGKRPEIRIYDTGASATQTLSAYRQAVSDDAQIVIGPLLKDGIEALVESGELTVPVLALNQLAPAAPDTQTQQPVVQAPLYQFGLSPEQEADQVAERLYREGHLRAVSIAPDNAWGQRVYAAFSERYTQLGGEIVESATYTAADSDFKAPLEQLMNLDSSKARYRAIQNLLGKSPEFEPRRRQDAQAVFMLGFPGQVRLLKPQLRFHHAGDLPVYSTSHVYTAHPDRERDQDLDGLYFCDLPWVLDQQGQLQRQRGEIESAWPVRGERFLRLYALGMDAYDVIPWLEALEANSFGHYPGATGELYMDPERRLYRSLPWARFYKGVPVIVREETLNTY